MLQTRKRKPAWTCITMSRHNETKTSTVYIHIVHTQRMGKSYVRKWIVIAERHNIELIFSLRIGYGITMYSTMMTIDKV